MTKEEVLQIIKDSVSLECESGINVVGERWTELRLMLDGETIASVEIRHD